MIINLSSTPHVPGLRGHAPTIDRIDGIDLTFSNFKMNVCKRVMDTCSEIIRSDKVCYTPGNCTYTYKKVVMPITHSFCSFSSDQCNDPEFEEALQKLYSAGALSFNMEDTKQIDQKISELNELRHKIRMVNLGAHAEQVKEAREKYLQERTQSHKSIHKSSKRIDTHKKLDEEKATV